MCVLGTGFKECVISGLLSKRGLKVLHVDRNDYYGGESASLNLTQLYERYKPQAPPPAEDGPLGRPRDYSVDLVPKFIMAGGSLVDALIHTDVTRYLEFKAVEGSFVARKGKVYKVPTTESEAIYSSLIGLWEKNRARLFFGFCARYREADPSTHERLDLTRLTMRQVYDHFQLEDKTRDFIGHALALYSDDAYFDQPALPTVNKIKLYSDSLRRYGTDSPFLYPLYGLGELPQAFARLSAVYGGTYMLQTPVTAVHYEDEGGGGGKVTGVTAAGALEGRTARCRALVGDPSYFPDQVRRTGAVARAICILDHPIPGTPNGSAKPGDSCQIIMPQKELGRANDVYIFCCSGAHNVAPQGRWVALVSTVCETDNPQQELLPGLRLLGKIDEIFFETVPTFEPVHDGTRNHTFITTSYDAQSHFESAMNDVNVVMGRVLSALGLSLGAST